MALYGIFPESGIQGLEDLREGVVRTPLAPFETFRDDPLRVIRCVRFASRFGFRLTPEVEDAMKKPEIKVSFMFRFPSSLLPDAFWTAGCNCFEDQS